MVSCTAGSADVLRAAGVVHGTAVVVVTAVVVFGVGLKALCSLIRRVLVITKVALVAQFEC